MGNHITSWGFTSATLKNQGAASAPAAGAALARSQWAALEAMSGSKWTPVPAQPMKWRSLPSQSENP